MKSYIAILVPEDKGGYSVFFPDVPGCVTQGEDMTEAQEMAADALSLWMEVAVEEDFTLPIARPLEAIKADKAWAKESEVDWRDATAVLIAVRPVPGKPKNVNVSLDSNKLRAIDAYAEHHGMTRSAVLEAGAELLMASDPYPPRHLDKGMAPRGHRVLFGKPIDEIPLRKKPAGLADPSARFVVERDVAGGKLKLTRGTAKNHDPMAEPKRRLDLGNKKRRK
jgi:predicted RNase H-like HicB family nuclease